MMMRLGWRSRSESELELESVDDGGDGMREGKRRGERGKGELMVEVRLREGERRGEIRVGAGWMVSGSGSRRG